MSWNTHIPKFRRFVLQNFPFIEEDFDALTDYALICKVVEYLNQVITSQNEVIAEVGRFETDVNNEIDTFETNITNNFNRLEGLFNDLKSFVDNYFDNLDVQEEINNKLEQMADDGTLQEIITTYIQSNVAWTFDSVADMKAATNLVDGSFAQTLGYYSVNDDGGALYKITDTTPTGYYETLNSGLYAELIIEDCMNIKQFGCKGDDSNNDTSKFDIALANCKKIFVPSGTYRIDRFLPKANQEIIGIDKPVIKLVGTLAPLCELSSNLRLENLHIVSANENLPWNRCNISNKQDITITNCIIEGFRHDSQTPNAWGILIGNSSRININSCFNDNSQSDVAMVNGCENISIDNCSGGSFFINIEPNDLSAPNNEISISNCKLARLNILENNFNGTATNSTIVSSCTIGLLKYDGGGATFVSCSIDDFTNEITSGVIYGGTVRFIDSGNFTKNLISDPYIDNYVNNTSATNPWTTRYTPLALADSFVRIKDENGLQFVLNQGLHSKP